MTARASLTCFRTCFLPGRAKDLSAPRHITVYPVYCLSSLWNESGAEINHNIRVLVGASRAGTDDGGIVSVETHKVEERLQSGAMLLLMSVNMSYETLIMPDTLHRTPWDTPQDGRQWITIYRLCSIAESVRKFLSYALVVQDVAQMQHTRCSWRKMTEARACLVSVSSFDFGSSK